MPNKLLILILLACFSSHTVKGQNNRINTQENIGWYNYFGNFRLTEKFGLHTEYQWRRDNYIIDWQQSLLRVGVNYQLNPRALFRLGYAWIETYPYGEIPINGIGRDFTEHRLFQMVQLSQKEGIIDFSHRFMLEQRFVGLYSSASVEKEDAFPLLNRIRYMVRLQLPLRGKEIRDNTPYFALYDEIFIGFGENVNANVFDQNRIGVLLGYRFNKKLRIEGGYLNQTIQFGRQINGQNVFQSNNGLIINANFNIDIMKKEKNKTVTNSTYPKVAVQWLNQALCIYQNLCLVDSVVLRNRHLRVAAKRPLSLQADLLYPIFAIAFCSFHTINCNNAKDHSA